MYNSSKSNHVQWIFEFFISHEWSLFDQAGMTELTSAKDLTAKLTFHIGSRFIFVHVQKDHNLTNER